MAEVPFFRNFVASPDGDNVVGRELIHDSVFSLLLTFWIFASTEVKLGYVSGGDDLGRFVVFESGQFFRLNECFYLAHSVVGGEKEKKSIVRRALSLFP